MITKKLDISEFLKASRDQPVIDVRTPSEFKQGHIPGAFNIPLFTDEERAEIGTIYKQESRDASIRRGLDIVGPKMRSFVDEADKFIPDGNVLVHCWRGGMRSESMAWLLNFSGIKAQTLSGGYKVFRNYVLDTFNESWPIIILGGMTGSGKTEVLHHLSEMGEQVIDLEGLANHKGSAFGAIGEDPQPTNEHFENELAFRLLQMDKNRPIWLEDESHHIGRNLIPNALFEQMRSAPVIKMNVPSPERIKHLINVYSDYPNDQLRESIQKIERRLGGLRTKQALEALDINDYGFVAESALNYYDKTYTYGLNKRDESMICPVDLESIDHSANAKVILSFYKRDVEQKVFKVNGN
jgi:tRNA 2-selenouridine synthase